MKEQTTKLSTKMKRSILNLTALFISTSAFAQGQTISKTELLVYVVAGMVLITLFAVIATAFYVFRVVNLLTEQAARERAERLGVTYVKEPSLWHRISQKLTRATPVEKEEAILLDHSYDGIRELDNHLPPWWKWLFYGTIVWGVIYLIVYHVMGLLPLSEAEYLAEVERVQAMRATREVVEIDEASLVYTPDAEI